MVKFSWRHWRQLAVREKTDHRQLAPTGANWRKFAKFANGAISAKLAKIKLRNRVYTYLRIANWRCRQLAPKIGAIRVIVSRHYNTANWRCCSVNDTRVWRQFQKLAPKCFFGGVFLALMTTFGASN